MNSNVDYNFTRQMQALAGNANMSYVTNSKQGLIDCLVQLYNMVHGYNSHKLKTLDAKAGQSVGLAFIKMALFFDNGDSQVNEIAAQNAFYCIAKNYLETGNSTAIPAIFTLLIKKTQTLEDELYDINPDPSLSGMGRMLPSADFTRRSRVIHNALCIMCYLLPNFYDIKKRNYLIDPTIPYHIPSQKDIDRYFELIDRYNLSQYTEMFENGKDYFESLYENIDDQLDL